MPADNRALAERIEALSKTTPLVTATETIQVHAFELLDNEGMAELLADAARALRESAQREAAGRMLCEVAVDALGDIARELGREDVVERLKALLPPPTGAETETHEFVPWYSELMPTTAVNTCKSCGLPRSHPIHKGRP